MLVNSMKVLQDAKKGGYAVPAPNVFNLVTLKGVLKASTNLNLPIMVSVAEGHLEKLSLEEAVVIVSYYAKKLEQDVVLHLDHGFTTDVVKEAIDAGFTSVMIDGSSLSYDENVKKTKEIVEYAKGKNVTVEAEIGHVGGGEFYAGDKDGDIGNLTTVEEAVNFVKDTGINSLAISIGTAHGEYNGVPHIDFERLKEINNALDIPLVLHGGSGTGDENLKKAAKLGISKVNIFTDLANAARANSTNYYTTHFFDSCNNAENGIADKLMHYYGVFETKGNNND